MQDIIKLTKNKKMRKLALSSYMHIYLVEKLINHQCKVWVNDSRDLREIHAGIVSLEGK